MTAKRQTIADRDWHGNRPTLQVSTPTLPESSAKVQRNLRRRISKCTNSRGELRSPGQAEACPTRSYSTFVGRYPGRYFTRSFFPGSFTISTSSLRKPSLGLAAG